MKKVERHQIKRDELVTVLERAGDYFAIHSRRVLLIAGAVVLAAVGGLGARAWLASREARALELVGEVIRVHHAPILMSPEAAPEASPGTPTFATSKERDEKVLALADEVLARYSFTRSMPKALYYRGLALSGLRRDEEAEAAFAEFLRRYPGDFLAPLVRYRLARGLEARGQQAEALVHFQALLDDSRSLFPREEGLLGVARCQEALGNRDEALKAYRKIVDDHPDSEYRFEADRKIEELS
jgi:TolA-binding protein